MIVATWANQEQTTLEVALDGTTSYVTLGVDGLWKSEDNDVTAGAVMNWMEEGNVPGIYPGTTEA